MDEKAVNAKGIGAVKPELDRIAAVQDKGSLIDEIAHVHLVGPNALFNLYSAGANGNVSSANTMPCIVDAVRAYATVGEICEALGPVYGTYTEVSIT